MLHITPMMCGGQSQGPEPTITSVSNTEERAIACGVTWRRNVGWALDFFNDAGYEIEIYDDVGLSVIASGLLTSVSPFVHDTGDTGNPALSTDGHDAQYTVRLIKKADSSVVDSMQTANVHIDTGPPC